MADIFRAHGERYRERHMLTALQRKAMRDIEACRTAALGGHLDECVDCGHERPSYNSCRNRHCPKCQGLAQARWLEKRRERVLPVPCFHAVFTLPAALRPLAVTSPRVIYDLLFRSASSTLMALGRDPKWLGGQLGVTAVLHTWQRDLRMHPHVHCVVTGGGLSADGTRWVEGSPRFLFPVVVMGRLFRARFMASLRAAEASGELTLSRALQRPGALDALYRKLLRVDWVVYCKQPFAGAEQVFAYLGRYTHRVGLSNHRLLDVTDTAITIALRDGATANMSPEEFIGRFLQHVLPSGFVKIRHYGLLASANVHGRLEQARRLLESEVVPRVEEAPSVEETPPAEGWREMFERLTGLDLRRCERCRSARLVVRNIPPAVARGRSPPRGPPSTEVRS